MIKTKREVEKQYVKRIVGIQEFYDLSVENEIYDLNKNYVIITEIEMFFVWYDMGARLFFISKKDDQSNTLGVIESDKALNMIRMSLRKQKLLKMKNKLC